MTQLQSAAERLAEKAVPVAERAWARSPEAGPGEEEALARIAEAHGLGPVRAMALRREVEVEGVGAIAGTPKAGESA